MKKMMMLAVMGLLGTAGAANELSGNVLVKADVKNVCLVGSIPFTGINLGSLNAQPSPFTYTANGGAEQGAGGSVGMVVKCTNGTPLTVTTSTTSGTSDTGTAPDTLTGTMSLNSPDTSTPLKGSYKVVINKSTTPSTDGADTYGGTFAYKADANQWGVMASAKYTGTLTITLSYN